MFMGSRGALRCSNNCYVPSVHQPRARELAALTWCQAEGYRMEDQPPTQCFGKLLLLLLLWAVTVSLTSACKIADRGAKWFYFVPFPSGFHVKACRVIPPTGLRRVWPIHPQRLCRILCSTGIWNVRCHNRSLLMILGHQIQGFFLRSGWQRSVSSLLITAWSLSCLCSVIWRTALTSYWKSWSCSERHHRCYFVNGHTSLQSRLLPQGITTAVSLLTIFEKCLAKSINWWLVTGTKAGTAFQSNSPYCSMDKRILMWESTRQDGGNGNGNKIETTSAGRLLSINIWNRISAITRDNPLVTL